MGITYIFYQREVKFKIFGFEKLILKNKGLLLSYFFESENFYLKWDRGYLAGFVIKKQIVSKLIIGKKYM